ncbi:MAG: hypothetical protein ABJO36_08070 [Litorimonas sp.]
MGSSQTFKHTLSIVLGTCLLGGCVSAPPSSWILVDDFQADIVPQNWTVVDTDNQTDPFITNPQVMEIMSEVGSDKQYLLKKPAPEGVIGNRKAISFHPLPLSVSVGDTATLYTRINVEYFPNNHSYGLSNLSAAEIPEAGYDAFEPMIRITDKAESDGTKNDGTLMVLSGYKTYDKIGGPSGVGTANPMAPGKWYEVWAVINNSSEALGGQTYDLYVRGGEFGGQTKVFSDAVFRMKRAKPLTQFITISNTGSKKSPYGNGGVYYDDIYIAPGVDLTSPTD